MINNFNLIPWDSEAYLIAADWYEEQGFLIPNAIRNKVLPLDIECLPRYNDKYNLMRSNGSGIINGGHGVGASYSSERRARGEGDGYGDGNGYGGDKHEQ